MTFAETPIISILLIQSLLSGVWVYITPPEKAEAIAYTSIFISIAIVMNLYWHFDPNTAQFQFVENIPWITYWSINYQVGIDGISLPLIMLTVFINLIIIMSAKGLVKKDIQKYWGIFFFLQAAVIGVFVALNAFLYYLFWEGMLIPMYLCIGIWGSQMRSYAAMKFFIFTFFGSVLMLIALIYLSIKSSTSFILDFYDLPLTLTEQTLILIAFLSAFAVKVPMWPVHTWLPDAHTEAPAGGSVILAALMLKVGAYGFFRFCLPIVPNACSEYSYILVGLSLIAIVVIGLVAFTQKDMKKLIAYSSVAHMGFVSLGCFIIFPIFQSSGHLSMAYIAVTGAMIQMITHAFGSGAMFLAFGMLYDQLHSRLIADMGGVVNKMPILTLFFMLFVFANIGVPGTAGFVGEFMVLVSSLEANIFITILAGLTLILSASYSLFMFKRVFYGPVQVNAVNKLKDINTSQILALSLLSFGILFIGIYPYSLTHIMERSVINLVQLSLQSKV